VIPPGITVGELEDIDEEITNEEDIEEEEYPAHPLKRQNAMVFDEEGNDIAPNAVAEAEDDIDDWFNNYETSNETSTKEEDLR